MSRETLPSIAHVITGLEVGGAERMLARIVTLSTAFRHEVFVLASKDAIGTELEENGIRVHPFEATGRSGGARAIARLASQLRLARPALVHSWLVHANIAAALATPPGTPLVWGVRHTLDGFEKERFATRLALRTSAILSRRARAIIYNSRTAAKQHEAIGYPRASRIVLPNGFELEAAARARQARAETRSRLGVDEQEPLIGLVARCHPIKNHEGFLEAAAQVAAQFPSARFLFAGRGTEPGGRLSDTWGHRLGERGLWLGERSDIARITAALDIACNVSFGEAFSNTVGEAMASGVPVLATDVGESRTIVGATGWIVDGSGPDAIAGVMRAALSESASELERRGTLALERIESLYSIGAVVNEYETFYRAVAAPGWPDVPGHSRSAGKCAV